MSLIKQIRVEKYLRNKYKPHVADAYLRSIEGQKGAAKILKQNLGRNGAQELKDALKRFK